MILSLLVLCNFIQAANPANEAMSPVVALGLVPQPTSVTLEAGKGFTLDADTVIVASSSLKSCANYLAETLRKSTGFPLPVKITRHKPAGTNCIMLGLDAGVKSLGPEGYTLTANAGRVEASGSKPAGILYACQTLLQLLPPEALSQSKAEGVSWLIPLVKIEDQPRFEWRGLMLDPARFFLSKDFIKHYINLLSLHKMNRLHLHLTDSEAWTVEIKAYPRLTDQACWPFKIPERPCGIYTQDDIREIVKYAAARNVTVVPEIEFPAHSSVVMAAYPELMCANNPLRTGEQKWGDKSYEWAEYCIASKKTDAFVKKVLNEVIDLFPSPYIHVGGDEYFGRAWKLCPDCQKHIQDANLAAEDTEELKTLFAKCTGDNTKYLLYRDMMRRVCAMVVARGRVPMIWDDLAWRGKFPPGSLINQWHYKGGMDYMEFVPTPENPAVEAANTGHDAVSSPFSHLYFDLGDPRNTELVYQYEPMPDGLTPDQARHILGPHAPAWAQHQDRADEIIFPRLVALSEVGWTQKEVRNWNEFVARSRTHYKRLAAFGLKFPRDWAVGGIGTAIGTWKPEMLTADSLELEWNASAIIKEASPYEIIMAYQKGEHGIAIEWVALLEDGKEIARDTHHAWSGYQKIDCVYKLTPPAIKPGASYTIKASIDCHLGKDSTGDVLARKME